MMRSPKTFKEQIEELRNEGIIITDESRAIKILRSVSFSRIKQYMTHIIRNIDSYGISLIRIYDIYEFDRRLRLLLLEQLEKIEVSMRAKLAYHHAHTYGSFGYRCCDNFGVHHKPAEFENNLKRILNSAESNSNLKYNTTNEISIFDIIEMFSFGMISKFYADMHLRDRKKINREHFNIGHHQIQSWLVCLTRLRNKCAHYSRLYNDTFNKIPRTWNDIEFGNTLFDYIRVMKYMLNDYDEWWGFMLKLNNLLTTYRTAISLKHLGFPDNWKELLLKIDL